jgi:hypothetical protein
MSDVKYREGLPPRPKRMLGRPLDRKGYPVPFFVAYVNGEPDHRIADPEKYDRAVKYSACWICGEKLGSLRTFVIGPMCAVNRTTADPPSHYDCAEWAVRACPFMLNPNAKRRKANLPELAPVPGEMIPRNPGVMLLWTTQKFHRQQTDTGPIFRLGDPTSVSWVAQGRPATRAEIMESIDSGMPILADMAAREGPLAVNALQSYLARALELLPA